MSNLKEQLQKLDVSKLKTSSGNSIEKELKHHARILANCIMHELDKVYDSYEPKVYERTYGLYHSLHIGNMQMNISSAGASLGISLIFDDGAIHKGFDGSPVNVGILLNEGWKSNFSDVPYFGEREGTHFIEKAIQKYKHQVKNPFTVKLKIGNEIRKF